MKLNFFKKYFLTSAFIFLICLTVMVIILSILVSVFFASRQFDLLEKCCDSVEDIFVGDFMTEKEEDYYYSITKAISKSHDADLILLNSSGHAVICTCKEFSTYGNCIHMRNDFSEEILLDADNGGVRQISNLGGRLNELSYVVGRRLNTTDGNIYGYCFAVTAESSLIDFYRQLFKLYFFSALVPLIIMFIALYFITNKWTRPLKLLSAAASRVAKGDFSQPIPIYGNDELSEACQSFNEMTDSLSKLETMRRSFVADVSHELKTPMTTIGGFVDGILDGTIEPDKQEYYLKIISSEIKRLSRMVYEMLNLSKLESGNIVMKKSDFRLNDIILEIFVGQEQRIESKNLNINGLDMLKNIVVCADKDLIYQAIYNLCDNAIKFTPAGGRIDVSLTADDKNAYFYIRNTGNGIDSKDIPFIFDRFFKGDKSRALNKDSTGIGLYIVKSFIRLHDGDVSVNSIKGEYAEFVIKLPFGNMEA